MSTSLGCLLRKNSDGSDGCGWKLRRRGGSDGRVERVLAEERLEVVNNLILVDCQVVVEQEQELFLHQVDFRLREHLGVPAPMLVLWGRVVEVLGGDDEGGKEDSVSGARHSFGDFGKSVSKSFEIHEGGEEGRHLDVGLFADHSDEGLE